MKYKVFDDFFTWHVIVTGGGRTLWFFVSNYDESAQFDPNEELDLFTLS